MSTPIPKTEALLNTPVAEDYGAPFRLLLGEPSKTYLVYPPRLTPDAFWEFCRINPDVPVEQDAEGRLLFMQPVGWEGGTANNELGRQLGNWNIAAGEPGYVSDSSTGYRLPNGATRSPDASWTLRARIDALTPEERQRFAPLCPDFVIELMSPSDSLMTTQAKMEEYRASGARPGLLIDRGRRVVEVYRPEQTTQSLENPQTVSSDPELPGFILDLSRLF